ncbi:hypothetical protein GGS24DRAFT_469713 [Hypoxylon argillaceum]|nr:hypothetical protein GGS24DRAFT_469713 [Hypoxylon argillaceum]
MPNSSMPVFPATSIPRRRSCATTVASKGISVPARMCESHVVGRPRAAMLFLTARWSLRGLPSGLLSAIWRWCKDRAKRFGARLARHCVVTTLQAALRWVCLTYVDM